MSGFEGLRVLEIGDGLSGAYAGLVLASLGADVVQWNEGLVRRLDVHESAWFDRGRTVVDGGDLHALLRSCDLVITDLSPATMRALGLPTTEAEVRAIDPRLVQVSVTPFGLDSPFADYVMTDLTEWAATGLAYATRREVPMDNDEDYTPVLAGSRQPEVFGGLTAALGALAALSGVRGVLVDVSRQQAFASTAQYQFPILLNDRFLAGHPRMRAQLGWTVPTSDGEVYLRTVEERQWTRLAEWMGDPEWASSEVDGQPLYRADPELACMLVGAWSADFTCADLVAEGQRRGVPVAMMRDLAEVLEWPHLEARGLWVELADGASEGRGPRVPLVEEKPMGGPLRTPHSAVQERWATA